MELEEFEFDLADVDVAAFESVATEDANAPTQDQQQQQQQQQQSQDEQHHEIHELQLHQPQPPQPHTDQNQHHHLNQHHHQQHQQEQQHPHQPTQDHHHQDQLLSIKPLELQQLQQHQPPQPQPPAPPPLTPHEQQILIHPTQQQQFVIRLPAGTPAGKILLIPINSQQNLQSSTGVNVSGTISASSSGAASGGVVGVNIGGINHNMNSSSSNINNNSQTANKKQIPSAPLSASQLHNSSNRDDAASLRASTPKISSEIPKRKPCNCTKSQCLKLYCDCFANGEFCSGCNCTNCFNSLSKEQERQKAISQCLEKNPEAFRPKIGKAVKSTSIERSHTKGCNCKRSGCLKNYCECYEAKILCSNLCKCCGCKNYDESFERKSLLQSASIADARILKNLLPSNYANHFGSTKKCFINDKIIRESLKCLLGIAQQAEKDGTPEDDIQSMLQIEMSKCLKAIKTSQTI